MTKTGRKIKDTRRPSVLRATAYHEAGHVAALLACGGKIKSVTIERDYKNGTGGSVYHRPIMGRLRPDIEDSLRTRERLENEIIVSLAGPLAHRRFNARSYRYYHSDGDRRRIVDCALRLWDSGDMATEYLKWMNYRVKRLIEWKWPLVTAIAEKLIEQRTLEPEAIKQIERDTRAACMRTAVEADERERAANMAKWRKQREKEAPAAAPPQ